MASVPGNLKIIVDYGSVLKNGSKLLSLTAKAAKFSQRSQSLTISLGTSAR